MTFKIKIHPTPLSYYVGRLAANEPFSFVRYGNGEWDGIRGTRDRTGSGSQKLNVPGLQQDLMRSLMMAHKSGNYLLGMQNYMQKRPEWQGVTQWLKDHAPGLTWHDADVFHHASSRAELWPLIQELRKKSLIFIGPPHLGKISARLPYQGHVVVPLPNGYQNKKKIRRAILKQKGPAVFCFSAGPLAKVLIYELFPVLGKENFLIDFGSLWDVYVGVKSRSYHKKITAAKTKINFGG